MLRIAAICCAIGVSLGAQPQADAARSAPGQPADAPQLAESCHALIERDPSAAAEAGRRALALAPADIEAALCLGSALIMLGDYAEAVPPLERVLADRPDSLDALYGLAEAYAALDDPRAEQMYERLAASRPGDVTIRLGLIQYLWEHGKNDAGNQQMERLLEEHPGQPDLRITYALDLLRQQQFGRAASELERAWTAGGASYRVAYLLGNAWWEAGDVERALNSFRTAIAIDGAAVPARHDLGRLLMWAGRPAEAIAHLEKAAAAAESAAVTLDLGRSYEAAGRLEAAERAYREARALEPSLSPVHYALGRLLRRTGRHAEGGEALQTYHRLYEAEQQRRFDEKSRRAEIDLAWLELRRGRAAEALTRFERLGDTPEGLIGRAMALSRLKRHADAVRLLERARLLAPDEPRVTYLLARERAALESRGSRR